MKSGQAVVDVSVYCVCVQANSWGMADGSTSVVVGIIEGERGVVPAYIILEMLNR